jgi:hypothetical protein
VVGNFLEARRIKMLIPFELEHSLTIVKLFGFYPSMAQDMQSGFFQRKQRATIWKQHKQHWNQALPERIRYGHQDTVKAFNRILKAMTISPVKKSKCLGSVSPVREPPRTKTSRQQTAVAVTIRPLCQVLINKVNVATIPKGRNQSHTNQKSAVAQKERKMNIMGYVEVENCRLNRKLVSSHPNYQLELTKFYQGIGGEDCLD